MENVALRKPRYREGDDEDKDKDEDKNEDEVNPTIK